MSVRMFCVESKMKRLFLELLDDKTGATAIEYGLIAALVSIAIITGVTTLGESLNSTFTYVTEYALGDGKLGP